MRSLSKTLDLGCPYLLRPRMPRSTDESGASSDTASDDTDMELGESCEVSLNLSLLQSYTQPGETEGDGSQFAINGASEKRLKALLKTPPCTCGCVLPLRVLQKVCTAFWALSKTAQDAALWSLQCSSGRKTRWMIEGGVWFFFLF